VNPWRRRGGEPAPTDAAPVSPDDIARRIGVTGPRTGEPVSPTAPRPGAPRHVERPRIPHAHRVVGGTAARLILWRDASAVLLVVVTALLVIQIAVSGRGDDLDEAGGTGTSGPAVLGATGVPGGSPRRSIGPVVDPSLILEIEATPTPFVAAPTPRATPRPTARPARSQLPSTDPPTDPPTSDPPTEPPATDPPTEPPPTEPPTQPPTSDPPTEPPPTPAPTPTDPTPTP
jgi:hypothetical protein